MTIKEKLQQAADNCEIQYRSESKNYTHIDISDAFMEGSKSPESLEYWKEKEKLYSEEEVKVLCMTALKEDFDTINPNNWWFENRKK